MLHTAFQNSNIILRTNEENLTEDDIRSLRNRCQTTDEYTEESTAIHLVTLDNAALLPEEFTAIPFRRYLAANAGHTDVRYFRAKALAEWRTAHRFCPRCGAPLNDKEDPTSRVCTACNNVVFPRIDPCVIVLVSRGDDILLARHVQRHQDVFACLSGFIEAGESAEEAVKREVEEETGIRVKNIRYKGSQSWPFPTQFMLAFTAEYESGEIRVQEDEIKEAHWFPRHKCPATPPPGSIAYRLIHNEF